MSVFNQYIAWHLMKHFKLKDLVQFRKIYQTKCVSTSIVSQAHIFLLKSSIIYISPIPPSIAYCTATVISHPHLLLFLCCLFYLSIVPYIILWVLISIDFIICFILIVLFEISVPQLKKGLMKYWYIKIFVYLFSHIKSFDCPGIAVLDVVLGELLIVLILSHLYYVNFLNYFGIFSSTISFHRTSFFTIIMIFIISVNIFVLKCSAILFIQKNIGWKLSAVSAASSVTYIIWLMLRSILYPIFVLFTLLMISSMSMLKSATLRLGQV